MKKYTPLRERIIVTSRGINEDCSGVVVPEPYLRDSNVCVTEDGQTVIIADRSGYDLGDGRLLMEPEEIIAKVVEGAVLPSFNWILVRKCEDPEDEGVISSLSTRKTEFAEVLEGGPDSVLKDYKGWLAHVDPTNVAPQKVEDTIDDWLVVEDQISMAVNPSEET